MLFGRLVFILLVFLLVYWVSFYVIPSIIRGKGKKDLTDEEIDKRTETKEEELARLIGARNSLQTEINVSRGIQEELQNVADLEKGLKDLDHQINLLEKEKGEK